MMKNGEGWIITVLSLGVVRLHTLARNLEALVWEKYQRRDLRSWMLKSGSGQDFKAWM
jgi:hypothetical protein